MFKKWMKVFSKCALFRGIGTDELNIVFECLKPKVKKGLMKYRNQNK